VTVVLSVGRASDRVAVRDFAEFARASMPGLLRYGHALTGNPHDAADLVQTVLEKIAARWSALLRKDRARSTGHGLARPADRPARRLPAVPGG